MSFLFLSRVFRGFQKHSARRRFGSRTAVGHSSTGQAAPINHRLTRARMLTTNSLKILKAEAETRCPPMTSAKKGQNKCYFLQLPDCRHFLDFN